MKYNIHETAKILRFSEMTIRRYIKKGKIKATRLQKLKGTICNKEDVDRLLQEQIQRGRI